ncbi:MAG: adenine phosphoribosyltransferase [bacterium]|nr:adenine phosphoribosyltransferase [bacterium]
MTKFNDVFSNRRVVLPVIHVESSEQSLRNAAIARNAGADGVFLINHSMNANGLLTVHREVFREHPDWWIGVNCLDLHPAEVFTRIDETVAGVWVDNAMIDERSDSQPNAEKVLASIELARWPGLYFGGVAFKYQRSVEDVGQAAEHAARFMDVVTTSGPGTGEAALPAKIESMKQSLGDLPLAIASGITPDNVGKYLPHADCFLVATGISKAFDELDAGLTKRLIETVRSV